MSKAVPRSSDGAGLDVVVTLPAPVVGQIEEAAKARGETVAGWCRATIIEAAAKEGQHETIERWLEAEASLPLSPAEEMHRRAVEPDPDR